MAQNRTQADAFIASVAQRPGVQRLPSGVLYTISEEGEGAKPSLQSRVAIEYTGRLADGTVFDESPEGETVEFPVGNVVPGFRDAILDMRPGETRTVYLSPDLAYGQTGAPGPGGQGGIPPNAALEFDITLREVLAGSPQGLEGALTPGN